MTVWLKQSTAVTVMIGPFIDDTDGKTAETGLTVTQAEVRLSKNGANIAQKHEATSLAHDELGHYTCLLDTTDTDTLGVLRVMVHESGALPVWQDFMVVTADAWDSMFGAVVIGQAGAQAALVANNLDHLAKTATAATDMTTEVTDGTIISRMISNSDTSLFVPATHSLQVMGADIHAHVNTIDGHITADYGATEKTCVDLLDDAAGGLADIHTDVGTVTTDVAAVHVHVGTIDGHITADYGATEKTCVDLLDDAAGGLADIHTDVADLHTDLADVHTDVGTAITNIGDVHATDLPALKTVVDDIHNTDLPDLHTDVAAVKTETAAILLVVGTNGVTVANINENAIDYESLKADAVDKILDEIVEGTLTMRHVLKLVLSAIGGKASGGGTATVIFRDNADSKARITLTVDASGNRTASVLDGA